MIAGKPQNFDRQWRFSMVYMEYDKVRESVFTNKQG